VPFHASKHMFCLTLPVEEGIIHVDWQHDQMLNLQPYLDFLLWPPTQNRLTIHLLKFHQAKPDQELSW
jgi:hypothetical protein